MKDFKNKRGLSKVWIISIIAFVVIAAVIIVFLLISNHINETKCNFPLFTISPISGENPTYISPLGNVNPPDHTIPTDHIYFYFENTTPESAGSQKVSIVSPGKITITSIKVSDYLSSSGSVLSHDYSIDFNVCKGINGYFYHLEYLSPKLQRSLIGLPGLTKHCQKYSISSNGDSSVKSCFYNVKVNMNAGDLIGTTSKGASALDFGMTNANITLNFINPSRYYQGYVNTVCPLDYFSSSVKSTLQGLLGDLNNKRTTYPLCGSINQDKAGTLQGNWFYGNNTKDNPQGWKDELSIIHNNMNFSQGEISIGGIIGYPIRLDFTPLSSGTFDREPSGVTSGNTIYCYNYSMNSGTRILLQLVNNNTLKAEEQQGSCTSSEQFTSSAKIYSR